jgi:GAF domain-containing protein
MSRATSEPSGNHPFRRHTRLAFIPLLLRGRVIGKFMAYGRESRPFTQADLELGFTIARQLGFSIERRQADDQRDLLVAELSHRVRNTLTTVMGIARETFSGTERLENARNLFDARLAALASAYHWAPSC